MSIDHDGFNVGNDLRVDRCLPADLSNASSSAPGPGVTAAMP
jgi:hypothetical protein